jgi:outer membrane lipoprotein-sorting protein
MVGMTVSRIVRWSAPVGVVGVVTAAALLPSTTTASAHPELPARSAAQLLADVAGSKVNALSGTVVATARLGLPELPAQSSSGAASPLALISGSHTIKVWLDGPQRQRVAVISQLAEYDVVRNGRNAWTYTSQSNEVTHATLPMEAAPSTSTKARGDGGTAGNPGSYATPSAAANAALKAVGPTTVVKVDRTARVAGRPAYSLVLIPRDARSLVASVRIAIDSATKTPLRVQVWATRDRAKPAVEVGFTDVRFRRPAASVFAFSAPPGASVQQLQTPAGHPSSRGQGRSSADAPQVVGTGWTAVAVVKTSPAATKTDRRGSPVGGESTAALDKLTTRVTGGRLLTTSLFSALLTDDGRMLIGTVAPQQLEKVAATAGRTR